MHLSLMLLPTKRCMSEEKTIDLTGDLSYSSTHTYSDTFVPIAVKEFSEVETRKKLQQLAWGMSMEEAEQILAQGGIQYYRGTPENGNHIVVEDIRYFLDFVFESADRQD